MKLEIRVLDDAGVVVAEYNGDPCQPGQWRAQAGKSINGHMPRQSDNQNTGTYQLHGFTYQPHLQVDRPNGYTAPIPGPNQVPVPAFLQNQKPSLWGPKSTPTAAPSPSANLTPPRGM